MGYSCSDFTDDVFAELHRVGAITEDESNDKHLGDNAGLQADYALKGIGRLVEVRDATVKAKQFMQELLDSVETLAGLAEQHGARSLADLMYLHSAILSGGFIDHYPDESKVLDIACSLPSGEQWAKFIKVEYMASADVPAVALLEAAPRQYRVGVDRAGFRFWTAFVMASSPEDAKSKALEQAGDHDFGGEYNAEYSASFVEPDDTDVGLVT
jgi:hypothetical protein